MAYSCDFLVLGSGVAGLTFALEAASHGKVIVATKRARHEGATSYAQGGIASVLDDADSFEAHVQDTLAAGAGLCRRDVVELCVRQGPERVRELIALGVRFSRSEEGGFDLAREGGHSARRVLHAADMTGREIERALLDAAERAGIEIREDLMGVDLITSEKLGLGGPNRCLGAYLLDRQKGTVETLLAPVTVLATGGCGKVYLYTSNPDVATGDGVAMAWRAGAAVANLEFMQFHPTCLFHPAAKSFLISEALRGEGGTLRLVNGATFMERYHPMKSLAPRDVVARAIDAELKRTGDEHVLLDMTHMTRAALVLRFPNIYAACKEYGIDMAVQPIPVVPAAHYMCGGVATDARGQTTIPGLLAIGEVACTGLHGANRLASNSLLEGLVFGKLAAGAARELRAAAGPAPSVPDWNPGSAAPPDEAVMVTHNWDEIRRLMWNYVGIVRGDKRLSRARRRLQVLREEIRAYYWDYLVTGDLLELRNIADVAWLIVECALSRKESRGLHYTLDYPDLAPDGARDTVMVRDVLVREATPRAA